MYVEERSQLKSYRQREGGSGFSYLRRRQREELCVGRHVARGIIYVWLIDVFGLTLLDE